MTEATDFMWQRKCLVAKNLSLPNLARFSPAIFLQHPENNRIFVLSTWLTEDGHEIIAKFTETFKKKGGSSN